MDFEFRASFHSVKHLSAVQAARLHSGTSFLTCYFPFLFTSFVWGIHFLFILFSFFPFFKFLVFMNPTGYSSCLLMWNPKIFSLVGLTGGKHLGWNYVVWFFYFFLYGTFWWIGYKVSFLGMCDFWVTVWTRLFVYIWFQYSVRLSLWQTRVRVIIICVSVCLGYCHIFSEAYLHFVTLSRYVH